MMIVRLFFILTFLTGVIYPMAVTLISQTVFPEKANGSLLKVEQVTVGSSLIGQKFESPNLFHGRPSAVDFQTIASGASQASPTQLDAKEKREARRSEFPRAGIDLWTASGSGLDPHLSPVSAHAQVERIASANKIDGDKLHQLIDQMVEAPTLGIWGQPRVNVLELNLRLMKEFNVQSRSAAPKS